MEFSSKTGSLDIHGIREYYDGHAAKLLRDFETGNDRVERGWRTLVEFAPKKPKRILELGCGIGAVSWRMARRWPNSVVIGKDLSPYAIHLARNLFSVPNLQFSIDDLTAASDHDQFDLVLLMDVYEHIPITQRPRFHEYLRRLLSPSGRVVLTFPTPRFQSFLRQHTPSAIQPVDEDVDLAQVGQLADDLDLGVLLYREVDVWREGDYAHAVLARPDITQVTWQPKRLGFDWPLSDRLSFDWANLSYCRRLRVRKLVKQCL
ncbi:MAG: class I SAM-dependent methyltransferase [Actinomycetota bacterium]